MNKHINPREVGGNIDYEAVSKDFDISLISNDQKESLRKLSKSKKLHPYIENNLVCFENKFNNIIKDIRSNNKFFVFTGRGPSNNMHLGHLVPFVIAQWFQKEFDCNVYIQLADDEKFLNKEHNMNVIKDYSCSNIADISALGFDENKTFIFKNTNYIKNIYQLSLRIAKQIDINKMILPLGLKDEINPALYFYPELQMAPLMFEQNSTCLGIMGVDQYPYVKMYNDMARDLNAKRISNYE